MLGQWTAAHAKRLAAFTSRCRRRWSTASLCETGRATGIITALARTSAGAGASDATPAPNPAAWPRLAATPTFAMMALLSRGLGGGPADTLCASTQDASVLSGMVPMYVLMSAFHSAPWLQLLSRQRRRACLR